MKKDALIGELTQIRNEMTFIKVSTAKIEEHLKTLNGTVARHEQEIDSTMEKTEKNTVNIAKLGAIAATAGGFGGLVVTIISHLL